MNRDYTNIRIQTMSDIPELDKIIEENHNFRFNKKMRNNERLFYYVVYFSIAFFAVFLFGLFSKFLALLAGFLFILCFIKFKGNFKDSFEGKDLYKRYMYK
jgi:hypothetical protein